jgi:hypothetical protein
MKASTKQAVLDHLSRYRRSVLRLRRPGIYAHGNRSLEKEHIIPSPKTNQKLNLLPTCRPDDIDELPFSLHKYFHHLNSSQALCINLFSPLATRSRLSIIDDALGLRRTRRQELIGTFEKQSEREEVRGDQRRTSFDFHLTSPDGPQVFFEVKYTEDGFGKATQDNSHVDKVRTVYRPLVDRSSFLSDNAKRPNGPFIEFFLGHYQVMRNLIHVDADSHVVFVFPSWNKKVADQAEAARQSFLTPRGRERVHIVHLEDLIDHIEREAADDPALRDHYAEFRRKYLPTL